VSWLIPEGLYSTKHATVSSNIGSVGNAQDGFGEGYIQSPFIALVDSPGRLVPTLPNRVTGSAWVIPSYGDLWFEQIHILPPGVTLGNLLVDLAGSFTVYNASLLNTETMTDIVSSGTQGITLTPPSPRPIGLGPLEEGIFLYGVSAVTGPAIINALYQFDFGAVLPEFFITGLRSIMWPFAAQRPMKETLEGKTRIIESRDGTEQRAGIRPILRQIFDMEYLLVDPQEVAAAKNMLAGHHGNPFAVIMWQYARRLATDAAASDTVINVDTAFAEFRVGEEVVLWTAWNSFEIGAISGTTDSTITVEQPLTYAHVAGTYVLPTQFCTARDAVRNERYQTNVTKVQVKWASRTYEDYSDISTLTTYKSKPVIDGLNFMQGRTLRESEISGHITTDFKTGIFETVARKLVNSPTSMKTWAPETPEDLFVVRQFLHWAKGKHRSWWLPTFRNDFQITLGLSPSDTLIEVKDVSYSTLVGDIQPFKDIYIRLTDGTVIYREIISAVNNDDGTETLEIDSGTGYTIAIEDVAMFSYLSLVRFNTEKISIEHLGQGRAVVKAPIIGVIQ